ncbi:hypothetical protein RRG08_038873 [Elysia crispata]|uniref:Uncharacterized protein n=1 Tax=Elysia crispata TaxID=231223 RepID=A0AAE0YSF6_9GAST|nr:hypothetical protein RRG08_038873 [Elysia crispata]
MQISPVHNKVVVWVLELNLSRGMLRTGQDTAAPTPPHPPTNVNLVRNLDVKSQHVTERKFRGTVTGVIEARLKLISKKLL